MVPFLEQYHSTGKYGTKPPREARVQVVARVASEYQFHELIVDLDQDAVVKSQHLKGKHSHIDTDYMKAVDKACQSDPRVQEEIKSLKLPKGATVCVEPWAYATDGMNDMTERTSMVSDPIQQGDLHVY